MCKADREKRKLNKGTCLQIRFHACQVAVINSVCRIERVTVLLLENLKKNAARNRVLRTTDIPLPCQLTALHLYLTVALQLLNSPSAAIAREERTVQRRLRAEGRHRHGLLLRLQTMCPQSHQHRVRCQGTNTDTHPHTTSVFAI